MGAGDLTIESAGERGSETFSDIRRPSIVQKEIYVQMEENDNRKYDRLRGGAPAGWGPESPRAPAYPSDATAFGGTDVTRQAQPPAGAHLTIPEQIEKLAELHDRGMLTDEEFSRKKAELLDRM